MAEILEAGRIVKTYLEDGVPVPVLKGLDLTLNKGEFAVLLGPSGSGKSTLLHILGLMDSLTSGRLTLSGRSAEGMSEEDRARLRNRQIGFVFQFDSLLKEFTALENILLPVRISAAKDASALAQATARAMELMSHLGLRSLAQRMPHQMSGGERQRITLCRALINKPALILADEPTGNLDKTNGELVFKDLRKLAEREEAAVVMATHNEAAADYADRVLRLSDGVLSEEIRKKHESLH